MTERSYQPRLSTGNEYISIPDISKSNAGIQTVGFLHKGFRACVEMQGADEQPLLAPVVEISGENIFEKNSRSDLISYWIPSFDVDVNGIHANSIVVAPMERRGFVCVITVENTSSSAVTLKMGWKGCWKASYHTANISKLMSGVKHACISSWQAQVPVIEFRGHAPLFALALVSGNEMNSRIWDDDGNPDVTEWTGESVSARAGRPVFCELMEEYTLEPSQRIVLPIYVGIGLEEVSAVASAQELHLQGWERIYSSLKTWLDKHIIECRDEYFQRMLNINSFYNYFYSQAITLDDEDLVVVSARSSRNSACAAYWDRDAMRYSLPAVLQMNWAQARELLIYAFTTQLSNVGVHSRFVDGIVLEPGLQLDQLCAPIRALQYYVQTTDDISVLFDRRVQAGVNIIQRILAAQRHSEVALFETLLAPSGKYSKYPYACYSNVLVWRILLDIGRLYERIRDLDRADEAKALAAQVRKAVQEHFIAAGPFGPMYAYSIDLQGNHELADDPAGSLQLLSYLGYCLPDDIVYQNTVSWIHSPHNPLSGQSYHFASPEAVSGDGPSLLSIVNDLLTQRKDEALELLRRAELDDGLACEAIDGNSGKASRGWAYASFAGYLAFGLKLALNAASPATAVVVQKRRPSETLYQPPPEVNQDSKKARM